MIVLAEGQNNVNELEALQKKLNALNAELNNIEKNLKNLKPQLIFAKKGLEDIQLRLEDAKSNLANLKSQLYEKEINLTSLKLELNDDEILDLKFIIKKLKNEKIPPANDEVTSLTKKEKALRTKLNELQEKRLSLHKKKIILERKINNTEKHFIKCQQEEKYRKDRLYKKLYVEFDDDILSDVFNFFNINNNFNEDKLKLLVDKHSEDEIYSFIVSSTKINKKIDELKKTKEKYKDFIITYTTEISKLFSISIYDSNFVECVMNNYSVEEVVVELFKFNPKIVISDNLPSISNNDKRNVCPKCGKTLYTYIKRCPYCNYVLGTKIKPKKSVKKIGNWCDNCFTHIPENSEYCPYCGSINIKFKFK